MNITRFSLGSESKEPKLCESKLSKILRRTVICVLTVGLYWLLTKKEEEEKHYNFTMLVLLFQTTPVSILILG